MVGLAKKTRVYTLPQSGEKHTNSFITKILKILKMFKFFHEFFSSFLLKSLVNKN